MPTSGASATSQNEPSPSDEEYDPRTYEGILHEISEPLANLLKFERKEQRLRFNVPTSYTEANAAFQQIRSKGRGGGGGHGSGTFWTQYVSGQTFAGRIQRSEQNFGGNRKRRPDCLTAEFIETADQTASFEVQAENADEFVIRINGGLVPYYLQVIQSKNNFSVQEVSGTFAYSAQSDSFEKFCRENPDYVQKRLLTILKHYGISSPITRFNQVTRDHVMALLSPADSKEMAKFREAFQGLESKDYEEREAATQKLEKEFDQWKGVLRYAAGSDQFSLEVRARLQKLIKEKSSESDRQLIALVAAGDLPNDAEYLVWLLGQFDDENKKSLLSAQLRKVTQQDLGTNAERWSQYLETQQPVTGKKIETAGADQDADSQPVSLATTVGYLPQMAEPTSHLLQLKMNNNKLQLRQESWAEQFNGEKIEDLFNRLRSQLEKSNLPKNWLNPGGGHPLQYVSHEHVLFEHIQNSIPPQITSNSYSYGNLSGYQTININRKVEQPHLFMRLVREIQETDKKRRRVTAVKNKPNVFRYSARERKDSHLEISFVEQEDSSLHLTIASWQAQSVFHLAQSPNGQVACHLLRQGVKKTIQAADFATLYRQQRDVLEKEFYPILARFGIQIPSEIGGPLEIKNAPQPASDK